LTSGQGAAYGKVVMSYNLNEKLRILFVNIIMEGGFISKLF